MAAQKPLVIIALLNTNSSTDRQKLIAYHNGISSVLRDPSAGLSTMCKIVPSSRPKAPLGMTSANAQSPVLAMVEFWNSKQDLKNVQANPEYKTFGRKLRNEKILSEKGIEFSEWTPVAGFVARKGEKESPKAGIVMLAKFVARDGDVKGNRDGLVKVLGEFCKWVEDNEHGTYSYCVLTSEANPAEIMVFERYADLQAVGAHSKSDTFRSMFKGTGKFVAGKKTVISEWEEVEGSFVSNEPGGKGVGGAKL